MKIKIEKGLPSGVFDAPPSKSYAHRLLICSALSGKECTVSNVALSEDILATLDSVKALGVAYALQGDKVIFSNNGAPVGCEFDCRESGSTLRFFIPIALSRGGVCVFKGTERLISRGISIYEDICKACGISIEY
jgi:3-phosphoshikimate 1-carboxyvinyltransferase